jgi:hypothetical protein
MSKAYHEWRLFSDDRVAHAALVAVKSAPEVLRPGAGYCEDLRASPGLERPGRPGALGVALGSGVGDGVDIGTTLGAGRGAPANDRRELAKRRAAFRVSSDALRTLRGMNGSTRLAAFLCCVARRERSQPVGGQRAARAGGFLTPHPHLIVRRSVDLTRGSPEDEAGLAIAAPWPARL